MEKVVLRPIVLLLLTMVSTFAYSQKEVLEKKISVVAVNEGIAAILDEISKKNKIQFSYNSEIVPENKLKTINVANQDLATILSSLLKDTQLKFREESGVVIIYRVKSVDTTSDKKNESIYLKGKVINCSTNSPVEKVNIFIANTTIGTSTNKDGFFVLAVPKAHSLEVVFSHVSHFPVIKNVKINSSSFSLDVCLQDNVKELKEVVIEDSRKEWKKNLEVFEREFLGTTPNASRCSIVNPWVLDFDYNAENSTLKATAQDLLLVENKALGYYEKHLLMVFQYKNGEAIYLSKVHFEEMSSKNMVKVQKWEKNREEAYMGSFDHFIYSLINHRLYKEGFTVHNVESLSPDCIGSSVKESDIITDLEAEGLRAIRFPAVLKVIYERAYQDRRYLDFLAKGSTNILRSSYEIERTPVIPQVSALELVHGTFILLETNAVKNPLSFIQHGYWSWKRVADALPLDYQTK